MPGSARRGRGVRGASADAGNRWRENSSAVSGNGLHRGRCGRGREGTRWLAGKPEDYLSLGLQAAYRNVLGQRLESSIVPASRRDSVATGAPNVAADLEDANARADALSGNCETVRRLGRPALALALCGDAALAEKPAAETSQVSPNGTIWNAVQRPAIHAAIELRAVARPRRWNSWPSASPYERAVSRGRVLARFGLPSSEQRRRGSRRVPEDPRSRGSQLGQHLALSESGTGLSLSYLGLARAFAIGGDTAKARKAFQDFFARWKDADEDLPFLIDAKKDYAGLRQ